MGPWPCTPGPSSEGSRSDELSFDGERHVCLAAEDRVVRLDAFEECDVEVPEFVRGDTRCTLVIHRDWGYFIRITGVRDGFVVMMSGW